MGRASLLAMLGSLYIVMLPVTTTSLVQAPWGAIQGVLLEGRGGRKVNGYLAIPYALPPVEDLRFERPVPHPGLENGKVFVADQEFSTACPQTKPGIIGASRVMGEDCLTLNIYVPTTVDNSANLLPVMVFIHGGGFSIGDAPSYRPYRLVADGNVIVVTIQYRLGIFGFLASGDDVLPGNWGLWDQTLALHWVKNNIQAFGGDPNTITIFGESAGSISVGLQVITPASRGLFKRAILQSGSPDLLLTNAAVAKAGFKEVVDLFGCQRDTPHETVRCLKHLSEDEFTNKTQERFAKSGLMMNYSPTVDGVFIPGDLTELLNEQYVQENGIGDIDVIAGFNNKEGSVVLAMVALANLPPDVLTSSEFYDQILNDCLKLHGVDASNVVREVVDFFYRGADAGTNNSNSVDTVSDLEGDCLMNAPIFRFIRQLAALPHTAPRYMYVLDHDFLFNSQSPLPGAHHGDDTALEFDLDLPEDSILKQMNKTQLEAPEELALADKFIDIVSTFARTGNPSSALKDDLGSDWPEFTIANEAYLSFSTSSRIVDGLGPYRDRVALWLKLNPKLLSLTSQSVGDGKVPETRKDEL